MLSVIVLEYIFPILEGVDCCLGLHLSGLDHSTGRFRWYLDPWRPQDVIIITDTPKTIIPTLYRQDGGHSTGTKSKFFFFFFPYPRIVYRFRYKEGISKGTQRRCL